MDKQYFFFDIDDTLYSHKTLKITTRDTNAIKMARDAGYKILLSTGRGLGNVFMLNLDLFDGIVCAGGGCVFVDNKIIYQDGYTKDEIDTIIDTIKPYKAEYDLIGNKYTYFSKNGLKHIITSFFSTVTKKKMNKWGFVLIDEHQKGFDEEIRLGQISKFTIRSSRGIDKDILNKDIFKNQNLMIISEKRNKVYVVEMTHKYISKGTGIQKIMEYFNKSISLVVAVGDSNNDLGITEIGCYSVAMKNGSKDLKSKVDYITKRDTEHSGVAEVIYREILIRILKNNNLSFDEDFINKYVDYALKHNPKLDDKSVLEYIKKDR